MKPLEPILIVELFPVTREALLTLLAGLAPADWEKPTSCAGWSVKDVALHLLGGEIGILSRKRDGLAPGEKRIRSWNEFVAFINELNDVWVRATRRMSPRVLCDLLRHAGPQVDAYFASLDPFATGEPVSWAGPEPAPVWLDLAREYTERWHHQQQIRDATGKPGLKQRRYFAPVLETFVRALPHGFRDEAAGESTRVELTVTGESGGTWSLVKEQEGWKLFSGSADGADARVLLDQEDAWRLFTRGLSRKQASERARCEGDGRLAARVLETVSVIA